MKLIVGLGNPDPSYAKTRHNFGFMVVDALAKQSDALLKKSLIAKGILAKVSIEGQDCILLEPMTYMNNSGVSVKALAAKHGIEPKDILIICDDLDLDLGVMRVRPSGSAGGHNGLKSIIAHLGTNAFARMRLGVGKPPVGYDTADYVLEKFTSAEQKLLKPIIDQALLGVHSWVAQGIESTMNQYNQRKMHHE